jgi:CHASE3 domain sensor protein
MQKRSLEKRIILAFLTLPILLLLVVGLFAYFSNVRLAQVAEDNMQTTQLFLEDIYEQPDDSAELRQRLKDYLLELQDQKAALYKFQRQSMLTLLLVSLNALVLFLLFGLLLTRQIRKLAEREKRTG